MSLLDAIAELVEANMAGLVDGTTGRPLPLGVDLLATDQWLAAWQAGFEIGLQR